MTQFVVKAAFVASVGRPQGDWIMMITMWAMALSVAAGAYVLVRKRAGLTWPALGWMAATLFAIVGLRMTHQARHRSDH